MNFAAFDAEMYPDSVAFAAPGEAMQRSGSVAFDPVSAAAPAQPAYVELQTTQSQSVEGHRIPEGRDLFAVFTPSQPPAGAGPTWRVAWGSQILSVLATPKYQAAGAVWRTWAVAVD